MASIIASAISIRSRASPGSLRPSRKARPGARAQLLRGAGDAVVKQRGLDALHPLRALADQRVAQPRPRAPLADMLGWNPRLRQPALGEQFTQPASVLA